MPGCKTCPGSTEHSPIPAPIFGALLLGGIYIPMPLSLWLTRTQCIAESHVMCSADTEAAEGSL
eukprot:1957450-Amphidinium_carterae.1